MSKKINISLREYAKDCIMKSKPKRKNFSEWIEELAMKQLIYMNFKKKDVRAENE